MRRIPIFRIIPFFMLWFGFQAYSVFSQSLVEADQIFANKRNYSLIVTPLDNYFLQNPGQSPNSPPPQGLKERLYRAFWQIDERGLWLTQLQGQRDNQALGLSRKLPIFASWYSGIIVAPTGKELFFDLSGEPTAFTHYQIWHIKNGVVAEQTTINYSNYQNFKRRQFEAFKKTKSYQDIIESLNELGISGDLDSYIFDESLGFLEMDISLDS